MKASPPWTSTLSALPRPAIHGSRAEGLCHQRVYNVTAAGFAEAPSNNITSANLFGGQSQIYNGVLINFSARRSRAHAAGRHQQRKDGAGQLRRAKSNPRAVQRAHQSAQSELQERPGLHHESDRAGVVYGPEGRGADCATLRSDQGAPLRAQYNAPVGTSAATPAACGRRSAASRRLRAARCRSTWSSPARCGAIASTN